MRFAIFLYDGVEAIDLATFGVLSIARRFAPEIEILTVAQTAGIVRLANGLKVVADHGFDDLPEVDVIVVTGGATWVEQVINPFTLDFLRARAPRTTLGAICTGAMVLGATGLLNGRAATTRCEGVGAEVSPLVRMARAYPEVEVVHASVVDQGGLVTGGGVCLCIDLILHLLERRFGTDFAEDLARMLEYRRAWDANRAALPPLRSPAPEPAAPMSAP